MRASSQYVARMLPSNRLAVQLVFTLEAVCVCVRACVLYLVNG